VSGFTKNWALEWVEGFIVSYFFGKTHLNVVKGVVKRVIESYGVKPREIGAIISLKTLDPALNIPRKTREEKAKPLLEFIEQLKRGWEKWLNAPIVGTRVNSRSTRPGASGSTKSSAQNALNATEYSTTIRE
jgi:hypothetical protein